MSDIKSKRRFHSFWASVSKVSVEETVSVETLDTLLRNITDNQGPISSVVTTNN